ncbi:hypothetical protein BDR22DRAFT_960838 [Usnea florida]
MPPPPPWCPSPANDPYNQLIAALHPPSPTIPEIEILPPSYPPHIHYDPPSIGIPKSLLPRLHLQARTILFSHLSSPDDPSASYPAALQATFVILLFDPNHLTAANFRKRHLQRVADDNYNEKINILSGRTDRGNQDAAAGPLASAVGLELRVCESLVTSALSKHAKCSTLWAQRLWVVRGFFGMIMRGYADDEEGDEMAGGKRSGVRGFWDKELTVVSKAGERHPSNYHAWQYARQVFCFIECEGSGNVERGLWGGVMSRDGLALVQRWCLMHPRDISGWAFLVFLLEQLRTRRRDEGPKRRGVEDDIRMCASETRDFAVKYEWKGESVDWFLKTMGTLDIDE